jgi:GT2 family glycosyltransferase
MKAIVIATVNGKCLPVLSKSIEQYVPSGVDVIIYKNNAGNYGDAYNHAVNEAFMAYDEIIVANDDIVLNPDSYTKLVEDVAFLKKQNTKIGWVVSRSDYARPNQQFFHLDPNLIHTTQRCSPLFGYVHIQAWVDYPPINWYSDDIQCIDMASKGYQHFISRSYVHHAGSQTIGMDNQKNHLESESWIKDNRPELHKEWYK